MTTNDEQYVPSDEDVRAVWVVHERDCGWKPHPGDPSAEFDRFLAKVRRDAAREAWTDCVSEVSALGWLHPPAALNMLDLNPYEQEEDR